MNVEENKEKESKTYQNSLEKNNRISDKSEDLEPGKTHIREIDEEGNVIIRRKRFSAV